MMNIGIFVSGLSLVTLGLILLTIWDFTFISIFFIGMGIILQFINLIFYVKKMKKNKS